MLRQLTLAKGWKQDRNLCSQEKSRLPGKCFLLRSLTNQNKSILFQQLHTSDRKHHQTLLCLSFDFFPPFLSIDALPAPPWSSVGSRYCYSVSREHAVFKNSLKSTNEKLFTFSLLALSQQWLWARWGCNSDPSGDIVLLTVEYHSMLQAGSGDRSEVHRGLMN